MSSPHGGPWIEEKDGTLYVHMSPGQSGIWGGWTFFWKGWTYTWTTNGWIGERGDGASYDVNPSNTRWGLDTLGYHNAALAIVVVGPFQMNLPELPEALDLSPYLVWPASALGTWPSFQVASRRLLQVTAYVYRRDGFIDIPLLDADDKPWLGTGSVPMMMIRKQGDVTTDYVLAPGTSDVDWTDANCFMRTVGSFVEPDPDSQRTFGDSDALTVTLIPKTSPVSHWVLRIQSSSASNSGDEQTVLVHLLGEGYGSHAASTYERGTVNVAGTSGEEDAHSMTRLVWTNVEFGDAPDVSILNERKMGRGVVDVESSHPVTTETIYLTTGASNGTAAGTALFSHADNTLVPMVMVLGHKILGSYLTDQTDHTEWAPESIGMGCLSTSYIAQQTSQASKAYYTYLQYDSATLDWQVRVVNDGRDGQYVNGGHSAFNRSFFVFSCGKG
jgi:hypothetical protein